MSGGKVLLVLKNYIIYKIHYLDPYYSYGSKAQLNFKNQPNFI